MSFRRIVTFAGGVMLSLCLVVSARAQTAPPPTQVPPAVPPLLSRVESPVAEIYSRRVNDITCTALAGNRTWLGTRLGIKRVETGKGIVRHYDQDDGLPGDVVEAIAADTDGAVALIQVAEEKQALCWWDRKQDRWQEIARVRSVSDRYRSYGFQQSQQLGVDSRWRLVLTPQYVVLAPPEVNTEPFYTPESASDTYADFTRLPVWRREALLSGNRQPHPILWNESMRNEENPRPTRFLSGATAVGDGVFLADWRDVYYLSPETLAQATRDTPDSLLRPVIESLPRFRATPDGTRLVALAAGNTALWSVWRHAATKRDELVQLTPVFQNGVLHGLRQAAVPVPLLPVYDRAQVLHLFNANAPLVIPEGDGVWLLTLTDLLHYTGTRWERRDETGALTAWDGPPPTPDTSAAPAPPWRSAAWQNAPPASQIPDAIVRAWATGPVGMYGWLLQRFPEYVSALAQPAPFVPIAVTYPASYSGDSDSRPALALPVHDPDGAKAIWYATPGASPIPARLIQVPLRDLSRWQWQPYGNRKSSPSLNVSRPSKAHSVALPALPTRVRLSISSFASRPDGLYVGTNRGVFRLPTAGHVPARPRLDTRLRPIPQPGVSFSNDRLFQAGPEVTLFIGNHYGRPNLRYDTTRKQFVIDTALAGDTIIGGDENSLYTTPSVTTPKAGGSQASPRGQIRVYPVTRQGGLGMPTTVAIGESTTPTDGRALPLHQEVRGTDYPFTEAGLLQIGIAGGRIWFKGKIATPAVPRYPHREEGRNRASYYGIAGYDLRERRWSRVLEVPAQTALRRESLFVQSGIVYLALYAPDAAVLRYDAGTDHWEPVAPALPARAIPTPGSDAAPLILYLENGALWLYSRGKMYQHPAGTSDWNEIAGPDTARDKRFTAQHPTQVAVYGDRLLLGGAYGLWSFDRVRRTWEEIAPLTSSLANLPVELVPDSLTVAEKTVYVAGHRRIRGVAAGEGFLLGYGPGGKWQTITARDLDVASVSPGAQVFFDGKALWYTDSRNVRRRDPAEGKWKVIVDGSNSQITLVPGTPDAPYLLEPFKLRRYDPQTGSLRTLIDTYTPPGSPDDPRAAAPPPRLPPMTYLQIALPWRGGLLLSTSSGLYHYTETAPPRRLPLPTLDSVTGAGAENGDVCVWDNDTFIRLPR